MYTIHKLIVLTIVFVIVCSDTIVPMTKSTGTLAATTTKSTTSTSTTTTPQKITVKLQRPPVYAYPGIITDFIITPALERTQEQIKSLFQYEFSDNKFLPPRMYISTGERNDQIRVMFDYQNDIPFRPFSVRFKVTDQKILVLGTTSISIVYDSISGGISNALGTGRQNDDFIR